MRWSKVLLGWAGLVLLASCGTAQNGSPLRPSLAAVTRPTEKYATAPDGPSGQQAGTRALAKQPAGGDAHAAVTSRWRPAVRIDRTSTYTVINSPLFSLADDHKPWPAPGSKAAKRQAAHDAQRERDVRREMIICRGC